MAKIYFRRQATIPPLGTNGIATFCTTNQTFYLDGIPYGGGQGGGTLSALTMESFWGGKTEIPIEDGYANIDLKEFANAEDVRQLLADVFVIKQELELDGPLDPSGDPRSAIDILNEDVTKIGIDLNRTKEKVALNANNIERNTDAIQNIGNQLVEISGNTYLNTKNIAVLNGKVDNCVSEHELLRNEVLHHHEEIDVLQNTYISGVSLNNVRGAVYKNVVYLEVPSQDALSAVVYQNRDNISALSADVVATIADLANLADEVSGISEELTDFEDSVADDITALSGAIDTKLEEVELTISGKTLYLNDNLGNTSMVELPIDQVVSGGTYDAVTEELVLYLTSGNEVRIPVSGLIDTYKGDNTTIVLNGDTFSVSSSITSQISANTEDIRANEQSILEIGEVVDDVKDNLISGVSVYGIGSGISVTSSITDNNVAFGVQILTQPIVQYLYDLLNYTYYHKASTSNITIDLTKTTSGTATATLTASRYRGLDYPKYTPTNPEAISVTNSTSSSSGWTKSTNTKWTFTYNVTDKTQHTATANAFVANVTNSDGVSQNANSVTPTITINKPYIIIEGTATPTASELETYLTNLTTANLNGVGDKNGSVKFTIKKNSDYFYICCPSNKKADYTKMNQSQINSTPTIVKSATYGDYKVYQSKAKQDAKELEGTLIITKA